jgi:hypothetical protein
LGINHAVSIENNPTGIKGMQQPFLLRRIRRNFGAELTAVKRIHNPLKLAGRIGGRFIFASQLCDRLDAPEIPAHVLC